MTDTATAPPPAATEPDPDRAVSARLDAAGASSLLNLLRTLFAYGTKLVETLRENDDPYVLPWYALLTVIFDTTDPAMMTQFVVRGLLRIAALHARLTQTFTRALLPLPLREGAGGRGLGRRGPGQVTGRALWARPRRPRATDWVIPPGWPAGITSLDRPPSPEEETFADILAEDENRPIGPILFDICVDLGIIPAQMPPAIWQEIRRAIAQYGADPGPLAIRDMEAADPDADPTVGRNPVAPIVYPPWPPPPGQLPPLSGELSREADQWGRGPGP
jgi:hypothetical protein